MPSLMSALLYPLGKQPLVYVSALGSLSGPCGEIVVPAWNRTAVSGTSSSPMLHLIFQTSGNVREETWITFGIHVRINSYFPEVLIE
jgi:hypothetical protein